jgi:hypothetical protein
MYTIIPHNSCHATEHKYAAIRYLCNSVNTYCLTMSAEQQERIIIHSNLYNNSFSSPNTEKPHNILYDVNCNNNQNKSATFTYMGKETIYITNYLNIPT